jgi:hypothetical protein
LVVVGRRLDDDGSGGCGSEAVLVGGDVADRIGCCGGGVDDDVARERESANSCRAAQAAVDGSRQLSVKGGRAQDFRIIK